MSMSCVLMMLDMCRERLNDALEALRVEASMLVEGYEALHGSAGRGRCEGDCNFSLNVDPYLSRLQVN